MNHLSPLALAFAEWDFLVNHYFPGSVKNWSEEDIAKQVKKYWRSLNAIHNRRKNKRAANPYNSSVEEWVWRQIEKHAKMLEEVLQKQRMPDRLIDTIPLCEARGESNH
ncbi:MAG: hypothetical protein IJJ26_11520 [Victivallales bacterium]|nr:hypothetical protein [Victivallales bacterium]